MATFSFSQVDVFSTAPMGGNPVAVVHGADGLSDEQMLAFARWTNLSETTFLLTPTDPEADYRLRIFTPSGELPFAGHPTLGSCHAWLHTREFHREGSTVVQECGAGLVRVRHLDDRLSFAAPPLIRSGAVQSQTLTPVVAALGLTAADVQASNWVDNGPGWLGLLLNDASTVLALRPDFSALTEAVGVIGPHPAGGDADFEVRAFAPAHGIVEDPVTGSLNAGLAQWLMRADRAPRSYVAAQGTALGRTGRVHLDHLDDDIWVGGATKTRISGTVKL